MKPPGEKMFLCCRCLLSVSLLGLTGEMSAQKDVGEALAETRGLLEEWIRTETLISKEAAQWEVEKRILQDIAEVARRELTVLERGLAKAQESLTEGETSKSALLERRQELRVMKERVELRLPKLEASLLERLDWFPAPLRDKIALYEKRIPGPEADSPKPSFLLRAQNIAVILRETDEFNGRITLDKPTMTIGDAGLRVYNVLYFGLAVAYFVDDTGKIGGVGIPAKGGWKWNLDERIAPIVQDAVRIRENEKLAEFLSLPFQLRDSKSP